MTVSGLTRAGLQAQMLGQMRTTLFDLQRQLATGQVSDTYGGLGSGRGIAVNLQQKLAGIDTFQSNITSIDLRLELMSASLTQISDTAQTVKSSTTQGIGEAALTGGQSTAQAAARGSLAEMLDVLNVQVGDRYLFSGLAGEDPATQPVDLVMDGDGIRAGFRQVVDERRQADLGADIADPNNASAVGRLTLDAAGSTVTLAEDGSHPFGFKLKALSTTSAATVSGPAGSPPAASIDFAGGQPAAGQTVRLTVTLPDGSTEDVTLTATASTTPEDGQFAIGATADETATNLKAALGTTLTSLRNTALAAASALAAGADFFDSDPPQRVEGPPFTLATALTAGNAGNTVSWYSGETGSVADRATMTGRVDDGLTVKYGVRADEAAIRQQIKMTAVFAAVQFDASDPDLGEAYTELTTRVAAGLNTTSGSQTMVAIQADLAGVQSTLDSAKARHTQRAALLEDALSAITDVDPQEAGIALLTLQVRLQASLQVTASIAQLSMANYI